jgi:hypothetical protein
VRPRLSTDVAQFVLAVVVRACSPDGGGVVWLLLLARPVVVRLRRTAAAECIVVVAMTLPTALSLSRWSPTDACRRIRRRSAVRKHALPPRLTRGKRDGKVARASFASSKPKGGALGAFFTDSSFLVPATTSPQGEEAERRVRCMDEYRYRGTEQSQAASQAEQPPGRWTGWSMAMDERSKTGLPGRGGAEEGTARWSREGKKGRLSKKKTGHGDGFNRI